MKKIVLLCTGIFIAFILTYFLLTQHEEGTTIKEGPVKFELIGTYEVDFSSIKKDFQIVEESEFTYFTQIYAPENDQQLENLKSYFIDEFSFALPEIPTSHTGRYMAITFGRELEGMEYKQYGGQTAVFADIILSETYNDNTIYVYGMDDICLDDAHAMLGENTFYLLKGDNKIFIGRSIFDINQRYPSQTPGM